MVAHERDEPCEHSDQSQHALWNFSHCSVVHSESQIPLYRNFDTMAPGNASSHRDVEHTKFIWKTINHFCASYLLFSRKQHDMEGPNTHRCTHTQTHTRARGAVRARSWNPKSAHPRANFLRIQLYVRCILRIGTSFCICTELAFHSKNKTAYKRRSHAPVLESREDYFQEGVSVHARPKHFNFCANSCLHAMHQCSEFALVWTHVTRGMRFLPPVWALLV